MAEAGFSTLSRLRRVTRNTPRNIVVVRMPMRCDAMRCSRSPWKPEGKSHRFSLSLARQRELFRRTITSLQPQPLVVQTRFFSPALESLPYPTFCSLARVCRSICRAPCLFPFFSPPPSASSASLRSTLCSASSELARTLASRISAEARCAKAVCRGASRWSLKEVYFVNKAGAHRALIETIKNVRAMPPIATRDPR